MSDKNKYERLIDELWKDQPYDRGLSVIRDILFVLLREKAEEDNLNVHPESEVPNDK